jgi:hypothetical protein
MIELFLEFCEAFEGKLQRFLEFVEELKASFE